MESKSGESGRPCLVSDLRGKDFRFSSLNMLLLSCFSRVRLFTAPWTIDLQGPLSMGLSRQEYWSGLPCPPPEDLPDPGIEPAPLMSPLSLGAFFTTSAAWPL